MHRRVRIGSLWIWCISLVPLVACIVWICAEWKLDQLVRPLLYFAVPMAFFMWWDRKELSAHGIDIPAKTVWISAFLFWPLYPFRRFGPVYDITHKGLAALITFCVFLTIFGQCLLSKIIEALE